MTTTRTTTSHTACTHAATKADRATCRKAARAGLTVDEMTKRRIADNATDSRRAEIRVKAPEAKTDTRCMGRTKARTRCAAYVIASWKGSHVAADGKHFCHQHAYQAAHVA